MTLKESLSSNSSKFNFVDFCAFFTTIMFFTNVDIRLTNI